MFWKIIIYFYFIEVDILLIFCLNEKIINLNLNCRRDVVSKIKLFYCYYNFDIMFFFFVISG